MDERRRQALTDFKRRILDLQWTARDDAEAEAMVVVNELHDAFVELRKRVGSQLAQDLLRDLFEAMRERIGVAWRQPEDEPEFGADVDNLFAGGRRDE